VKQQQNDRKLCAKDMGEKRSHFGLVFIFDRVFGHKGLYFGYNIFLPY